MKLFRGKVLVTVGIVTGAALVLGLAAPWVMKFYGAGYADRASVLVVMLFAAWISSPVPAMSNLLIARNRQWSLLSVNIFSTLCLLVSVNTFRQYGAIALAWSNVALYLAKFLSTLVVLKIHNSPRGEA